MAINVYRLSLEELEIDKVIDRERISPGEDDIDLLADQFLQKKETEALKKENAESEDGTDTQDDSIDENNEEDTSTEENDVSNDGEVSEDNTNTDETKNDEQNDATEEEPPKEENVAAESFMKLHESSINQFLLAERVYYENAVDKLNISQEGIKDTLMNAAVVGGHVAAAAGHVAAVGTQVAAKGYDVLIKGNNEDTYFDGLLSRLIKMGVRFSAATIRTLSKGILMGLKGILNGIHKGNLLLAQHFSNRHKKYTHYLERINKLKKLIEEIKSSEVKELDPNKQYDKLEVICGIKIGQEFNITKSVDTLVQFNKDYMESIVHLYNLSIVSTIALIKHIKNFKGHTDIDYRVDEFKIKNIKPIKNNERHALTLAYQYNKTFPGDLNVYFYVPDHHLKDYEEIKNAYHQCEITQVVDYPQSKHVIKSVPYMTLEQCEATLTKLTELCELGISYQNTFKQLEASKKKIQPSYTEYLTIIANHKNDITIKESLVEYIALKIRYMDQVLLGGAVYVDDINMNMINAAISYAKESVEQYIK